MANYEVLAETLGANPTYSRGDIIEDSGDLKPPFDFGWLERSGAIKKVGKDDHDRAAPASATLASEPAFIQASGLPPTPETAAGVPPGDLSGVDLDDDQRAALDEAGIRTPDDVRAAPDDRLLAVKGIGPATLTKLRDATKG